MSTSPLPSSDLLDGLSPSQAEAVRATEGPVLVLAGAGSGKTRVITRRIAHLLIDKAVEPHQILAVTFTNKAAREMRERVGDLLRTPPPRNLWVLTFHALGARLLRFNAEAAGLQPGFTIFDDTDRKRTVRRLCKHHGIDAQKISLGGLLADIGTWKSMLVGPDKVLEEGLTVDERRVDIYRSYEAELARSNSVDFADLIARPVRLLQQNEAIRDRYRRRFRYLMVDEYQDTNRAQYLFVRALTGEHANLCAVGDEDQSIYGWRGADIHNILDFEADFPNTRVLQLEVNYRCPKPVLEVANKMIAHNASRRKDREVWSEKDSRFKVSAFQAYSADQEAEYVVEAINWMCTEEGFDRSDCAVFYRTHAQARTLEQALYRRGVPYRVYGGLRFAERRAVKDLVCYLRLLVNPHDLEAFDRVINVPKRGIGPKKVQQVRDRAAETGQSVLDVLATDCPFGGKAGKAASEFAAMMLDLAACAEGREPVEVLRELTEALGYRMYLIADQRGDDTELVDELENALVDYANGVEDPGLADFLEQSALVSPTDELGKDADSVSLMTLHNAKGLEFPVVFVTGLEEGLLPHGNTFGMSDELEEERRLLYVGMTRTQDRLFLTMAGRRTLYGKTTARMPSRFMDEIGPELLDLGGDPEPW